MIFVSIISLTAKIIFFCASLSTISCGSKPPNQRTSIVSFNIEGLSTISCGSKPSMLNDTILVR